jgi:hypothetical protein
MNELSVETPAANDIVERGYHVMSSLLTKDECTVAASLVNTFSQDISYQSISNPSEEGYGSGWLLGDLREILADRIFEPLYQTRELLSSKEGFAMHPNTTLQSDPTEPSEVIRAAVILTGSARMCCKSILMHEEIELHTGDVLLWRSSLSKDINLLHDNTSVLFYCAMIPALPLHTQNKTLLKQKLDAYLQRRTGDCHPDSECWIADEYRDDRRHYYRMGPPLLTLRQAELYGLIPYQRDKVEMERAVVRGIRFVDHYENTRPCPAVEDDSHLEFLTLSSSADNNGLLMGQDKYLGGIESPCGNYVYGVPGTARQVLRVELATKKVDLIGPTFPGPFKWLRGVPVPATSEYPAGCCIALPCNSLSILKIVPDRNEVYSFGESDLSENCNVESGWFYHGGNFSPTTGCIYAIPANANRVMKFNPYTDKIQFIGPDFGTGKQKWYGGIEGSDGCIYGIPHNETGRYTCGRSDAFFCTG